MRYNKWKEANDYWRMVINKPFKIKGRNIMLLNYIATYSSRPNKSNYVTKVMNRFINYLNTISDEIYYCASQLNSDTYTLLYECSYTRDLIGINPYISITYEQMRTINNFLDTFEQYNRACRYRYKFKKPIINSLLDAIDEISPIQDVLRQYRYNKKHKRKHPYPVVSDNFIEHSRWPPTHHYDDYKKLYLDSLKHNIDITKTFYKYHPSLDTNHIFNKRRPKREEGYSMF